MEKSSASGPRTVSALPRARGTDSAMGAGQVFQLLRDGRGRTRAEIIELTGLSRSAVASRLSSLEELGLVGPAGEAESSGGRRAVRFAFQAERRLVLALDLGATHLTAGLADLNGTLLSSHTEEIAIDVGPQPVLDQAAAAGRSLLEELGRGPESLAGVGIGLPGPVEHGSGRPVKPPIMPGWDGFDVAGFVRSALGVPVFVDNDVNIMALGEQHEYWPEHQDLLFVKVATGIGAGIISGGALQRGFNGTAGDIGHIRVPNGADSPCRCGNHGCLEAVASGPALASSLRASGLSAEGAQDVVGLAGQGTVEAIHALRQAGRDVGEVLAACVNMLNPSVIVIGGTLAQAGDTLLAGVREVIYQRSLPLATSALRVVPSQAADKAALLGASRLAIDALLSPETLDLAAPNA